jgi:hypothetical protein
MISMTATASRPLRGLRLRGLRLATLGAILLCRAASAQEVTFSEHIAPIIFNNCTGCHRPGEIAPFPLRTYQEVSAHGTMIREVTASRYMPPWKAVHGFASYLDERALSREQIALIARWVDGGMPEGDPAKLPDLPLFPSGSHLGTPDLVLKLPEPYTHAGNGRDEYRCFVLPTGLVGDRKIRAIEFRPGNPKIVHHALLFLDTTGAGRALDDRDAGEGYVGFGGPGFDPAETYFPWAPGTLARFLPTGITSKMFAKSDLVIQIHYAPTTLDQTDQSSVNIFFADDAVPSREMIQKMITPSELVNGPFVIPAGEKKSFVAKYNVPVDFSVMTVAPHMHLLGRTVKSYVVTPAKDTIPLVAIDDWDFHWQGGYTFTKLQKVPRGSVLYYETTYDNTDDNPSNPNSPPKLARWGESTLDEMLVFYIFGVIYQPGDERIAVGASASSGLIDEALPSGTRILEPHPNPASESLAVPFTLASPAEVTLQLFDMRGSMVAHATERERLQAGLQQKEISVADLPAGTYICKLIVDDATLTRKVTIAR